MLVLRQTLAWIVVAVATVGVALPSHARCVLPVPDGGVEQPSPANVEGYIVSIDKDIAVIRTHNTQQNVSVRVSPDTGLYTAFGGIVNANELKVGQKAWVWFVGCKRTGKSVPLAAYFQIFSVDPNDRP